MPDTTKESIMEELQSLLRLDDVLACMLAKKGLEGLLPQGIKIKNVELWQLLKETTDKTFDIIEKFFGYGLDRMVFELGDYTVIIAPLNPDFSLLVVIPSLANMGLLDVEIENTKRKIKSIMMQPG